MLLNKCWADGQPPLPPCKVVWYQGCLRLGASSAPTQESVNAQGVWVLESCGTKPAHSSTILGDVSQSSGPQTSLNAFHLLPLSRRLGLDIYLLSLCLSQSYSVPLLSSHFFQVSSFILVCWSLFFVRTLLIKCQVILF